MTIGVEEDNCVNVAPNGANNPFSNPLLVGALFLLAE